MTSRIHSSGLEMNDLIKVFLLVSLLSAIACGQKESVSGPDEAGFTQPTAATITNNKKLYKQLPLAGQQDFTLAQRGLIAVPDQLVVKNSKGEILWDMSSYAFIEGEAPSSVNPSLWRQEKLNNTHGLFRVAEGIYQLRGFDLANMTIIEGNSGWIIIDPLTSTETAHAALAFAKKHLAEKPIKAIIFTHSHIDHFGGALGIASPKQVKERGIRVIAPKGFMEAATSENVIAGVAMGRRSALMYGSQLPRSVRGQIGSGLGKSPAMGTFGILEPSEIVDTTGSIKNIDGIEFVFQYVPGSEAPAEFTFYIPQSKVFIGAELVSQTMHNLYSLRGAHVRDALRWSEYIDEALVLFGQADILVNSHHWPLWGNTEIRNFLEQQRDMYRYIHDQSVRLLNAGLTPTEIAETIRMPESLAQTFSNRGYYGSLSHNTKAVYQFYLGWFDGNPAHLNPLPIAEASVKYVDLAGGADALMAKANDAFNAGDYRWVAQLLNHLVFAQAEHRDGKKLLAQTYDQLAYQAESAAWRNFYLSAAYELRHSAPKRGVDIQALEKIIENTSLHNIFSSLAVRLDAKKAAGESIQVKFVFSDLNETYLLTINNSVLHHKLLPSGEDAEVEVTLTTSRRLFSQLIAGTVSLTGAVMSDELDVDGSRVALINFFRMFDKPDGLFNIVTP